MDCHYTVGLFIILLNQTYQSFMYGWRCRVTQCSHRRVSVSGIVAVIVRGRRCLCYCTSIISTSSRSVWVSNMLTGWRWRRNTILRRWPILIGKKIILKLTRTFFFRIKKKSFISNKLCSKTPAKF